jgi:ADP-ribosylglycohydrolase
MNPKHGVSWKIRFEGAMAGVAIGDGMGMPVETMRHEEIMALNDGKGVTGFMPVVQTKFPEMRGYQAAATTDDWQLTAAVARSLIRTGGKFDPEDCLREHIEEWKIDNRTWGKGSRTAIAAIIKGERKLTDPPESIPGKTGLGNGIIMKIAPLALVTEARPEHSCMTDCWALGRLTHGDVRAAIGAYAVMRLMHAILRRYFGYGDYVNPDDLLRWLIWEVEVMESQYGDLKTPAGDTISGRLRRISGCLDSEGMVREKIGCGFVATETAPYVIATFLRHPTNFSAGVLEAVNAGGDADTNASIVGALIGLNVGLDGIPHEWEMQCPARAAAIELGDALFNCRSV